MAPSSRGRLHRGGGQGSGVLRGTKRRSNPITHGSRPIFYSTRVEEKVESDAEQSESQISEQDRFEQLQSSGSEDGDENIATAHPYNALLQSLNANANTPRGPPQRKKQKLDGERLKSLVVEENSEEQSGDDVLEDAASSRSADSSENEENGSLDDDEQSTYTLADTVGLLKPG